MRSRVTLAKIDAAAMTWHSASPCTAQTPCQKPMNTCSSNKVDARGSILQISVIRETGKHGGFYNPKKPRLSSNLPLHATLQRRHNFRVQGLDLQVIFYCIMPEEIARFKRSTEAAKLLSTMGN